MRGSNLENIQSGMVVSFAVFVVVPVFGIRTDVFGKTIEFAVVSENAVKKARLPYGKVHTVLACVKCDADFESAEYGC